MPDFSSAVPDSLPTRAFGPDADTLPHNALEWVRPVRGLAHSSHVWVQLAATRTTGTMPRHAHDFALSGAPTLGLCHA